MDKCFSCAVKGECTELYVKKSPNHRGPYFPIFERFNPPSSSNAIGPDGTVKVCKLCQIYLYSQWESFEIQGTPESRRMYFTKRHDSAAMFNGSMDQPNSEMMLMSPRSTRTSAAAHNSASVVAAAGGYSKHKPSNRSGSTDSGSALAQQLASPAISAQQQPQHTIDPTNHLTEYHIFCFVCGQPCLKCNSKTSYSSQVLESKEYFPFFEKLEPPPLSINLMNGATKICMQCESDLLKQWDDYEKSHTDQSLRTYHITSDHSTPFSIHNPGRFISNSAANCQMYLHLKARNSSLKCALCTNKVIDSYIVTWSQPRPNCLFVPNLRNFAFTAKGTIVDRNSQEAIVCDVCNYFLSCQIQNYDAAQTPLAAREYRVPKLGSLPALVPSSVTPSGGDKPLCHQYSDSGANSSSSSSGGGGASTGTASRQRNNQLLSFGGSASAFQPAEGWLQSSSSLIKREKTLEPSSAAVAPRHRPASSSTGRHEQSQPQQHDLSPIIANCHICYQELRDLSTLKTLRAEPHAASSSFPYFPFLKKLRDTAMRNYEFPVCVHCYCNLSGQWQLQEGQALDTRQYRSADYMCTCCRQLFAEKAQMAILQHTDRLVCLACFSTTPGASTKDADIPEEEGESTRVTATVQSSSADFMHAATAPSSESPRSVVTSPQSAKVATRTSIAVTPVPGDPLVPSSSAVRPPAPFLQQSDPVSSPSLAAQSSTSSCIEISRHTQQQSSTMNNSCSSNTSGLNGASSFLSQHQYAGAIDMIARNCAVNNVSAAANNNCSSSNVAATAEAITTANGSSNKVGANIKSSTKRPAVAAVAPSQRQNTPVLSSSSVDAAMILMQQQQQLDMRMKMAAAAGSNPVAGSNAADFLGLGAVAQAGYHFTGAHHMPGPTSTPGFKNPAPLAPPPPSSGGSGHYAHHHHHQSSHNPSAMPAFNLPSPHHASAFGSILNNAMLMEQQNQQLGGGSSRSNKPSATSQQQQHNPFVSWSQHPNTGAKSTPSIQQPSGQSQNPYQDPSSAFLASLYAAAASSAPSATSAGGKDNQEMDPLMAYYRQILMQQQPGVGSADHGSSKYHSLNLWQQQQQQQQQVDDLTRSYWYSMLLQQSSMMGIGAGQSPAGFDGSGAAMMVGASPYQQMMQFIASAMTPQSSGLPPLPVPAQQQHQSNRASPNNSFSATGSNKNHPTSVSGGASASAAAMSNLQLQQWMAANNMNLNELNHRSSSSSRSQLDSYLQHNLFMSQPSTAAASYESAMYNHHHQQQLQQHHHHQQNKYQELSRHMHLQQQHQQTTPSRQQQQQQLSYLHPQPGPNPPVLPTPESRTCSPHYAAPAPAHKRHTAFTTTATSISTPAPFAHSSSALLHPPASPDCSFSADFNNPGQYCTSTPKKSSSRSDRQSSGCDGSQNLPVNSLSTFSAAEEVVVSGAQSMVLDLSQSSSTEHSRSRQSRKTLAYAIDSLTTDSGPIDLVPTDKSDLDVIICSVGGASNDDESSVAECSKVADHESLLKDLGAENLLASYRSLVAAGGECNSSSGTTDDMQMPTRRVCGLSSLAEMTRFQLVVGGLMTELRGSSCRTHICVSRASRLKSRFCEPLGLIPVDQPVSLKQLTDMTQQMNRSRSNSSRTRHHQQLEEARPFLKYWSRFVRRHLRRRIRLADQSHLKRSLMRPILGGSGCGVHFCSVGRNKHENTNARSFIKILYRYA